MRSLMNIVAMELRLGRKHDDLWREAECQVGLLGLSRGAERYQKQVARCYAQLRCQQLDRSSHSYVFEQIRKGLYQRDRAFMLQLAVLGAGLFCALLLFYRASGGVI